MSKVVKLSIGLAVVAALIVAAIFTYIWVVNSQAKDELALPSPTGTAVETASPDELVGAWKASGDSVVGYRVNEVLGGLDATVTGRSTQVEGTAEFTSEKLTTAEVTVDMTSFHTDNSNRDSAFQGIWSTDKFPTATFTLTEPVDLGSAADIASGKPIAYKAKGTMNIHGTDVPVEVDLSAQFSKGHIDVVGSIPITFEDYGVSAPDLTFVVVEDTGTMEFSLVLTN